MALVGDISDMRSIEHLSSTYTSRQDRHLPGGLWALRERCFARSIHFNDQS